MNQVNEKDAELTSLDSDSPESTESSEIKRELNDAELVAVSGGTTFSAPTPPNGPGGQPTGNPPRMAS